MKNKDSPLRILKVCLLGSLLPISLIFLAYSFAYPQIVSPKISITSSNDPAGVTINIHGTGFSAGSTATLYAINPDGSQSGILSAGISHDGSFNISHLFPTGYPPGIYLFWVVDGPTGRQSNRINFNMPATQSTEVRMPPPPLPPLPPYTTQYTPQHGDLVRAKGDTKIYLVQGQQYQGQPLGYQRRAIANEQVFNQIGFKWSDVKEVDHQDLMILPEGQPIWSKELIAPFPEGAVIRLKGTTRTFVIKEGRKCFIPDSETFHRMGYQWSHVKEVDQATLDSIVTGIPIPTVKPPFQYTPPGQQPVIQPPPVVPPSPQPPPMGPSPPTQPQPSYPPPSQRSPAPGSSYISPSTGPTQFQPQSFFPDGTLIKGSGPDIYLIENGVRRLIPDMETFNAMGFNWNNIINVDDQKLESIPLGMQVPQKRRGR